MWTTCSKLKHRASNNILTVPTKVLFLRDLNLRELLHPGNSSLKMSPGADCPAPATLMVGTPLLTPSPESQGTLLLQFHTEFLCELQGLDKRSGFKEDHSGTRVGGKLGVKWGIPTPLPSSRASLVILNHSVGFLQNESFQFILF